MSPGMMKVAVRRSGLYQGLTRRSTGGPDSFHPALAASVRRDSWFEIPPAIAIAWLAVVVSEAFTTRRAFADAPRRRSLPKSWSITRPTEAWPASISWRSAASEATYFTTSKYSLAVIFATSSRLSYERSSSRTTVFRCLTS